MRPWALILGASSGFGKATALEFSKRGVNIIGIHLDRKQTMKEVEELISQIEKNGVFAKFYNINAADHESMNKVLDDVKSFFESEQKGDHIKVLLHSLAFGTLKKFIAEDETEMINKNQLEMTLDVMANTLVYWVQGCFKRKLFGPNARIFAMTSSGDQRVMPYYGAVSAAKAAIESYIRQLALELAPYGITANSIKAGVTDTPALRKIPGHEELIELALRKNPHKRLTTPEDVAKAIVALSSEDLYWMTGNVINVDGGEDITG
uniref:SDR family oxidoreductase n=1 Tax=candidate division WOR-3 bacterium TaxID=2052148 RepID=A0A7V4E507_UNCW3